MKFIKLKPAILGDIEAVLDDQCLTITPSLQAGFALHKKQIGLLKAIKTYVQVFFERAEGEMYDLVDKNLQRKLIRNPGLRRFKPFLFLNRRNKKFKCEMIYKQIDSIYKEQPHLVALIHNGTMANDSILALVANRRGYKHVFIENGYFPDTLQVDPKGINANNSLTRDPDFYRSQSFGADQPVPTQVGTRVAKVLYESNNDLPKTYIFVPFQVPSDMQITQLSPWVEDMEAFYAQLLYIVEKNPDIEFVIKEHPSYRRSLIGHVEPHPRIHFANGNATPDLIAGSAAVLTINSTVGIEALVLEKKVITLGLAAYNIEGLVRHCSNKAELTAAVGSLNSWSFDEELRCKFLQYLYYDYMVPGSFLNPSKDIAKYLQKKSEVPNFKALKKKEGIEVRAGSKVCN